MPLQVSNNQQNAALNETTTPIFKTLQAISEEEHSGYFYEDLKRYSWIEDEKMNFLQNPFFVSIDNYLLQPPEIDTVHTDPQFNIGFS